MSLTVKTVNTGINVGVGQSLRLEATVLLDLAIAHKTSDLLEFPAHRG